MHSLSDLIRGLVAGTDIVPLTLQDYAKKRNELAKKYGNKTMPPYMWKRLYETNYLPGLKNKDPAILSTYHGIRSAACKF